MIILYNRVKVKKSLIKSQAYKWYLFPKLYMLIQKSCYLILSLAQLTRYLNDVSKLQDIASCRVHVEWNFLSEKKT